MKKIFVLLLSLTIMVGIGNLKAEKASVKATNEIVSNSKAASANKLTDEEKQKLVSRLYEINSLDKSTLTKKEKRELRKEVLGIKQQLNMKTGVIVISTTALIIIILLIILL